MRDQFGQRLAGAVGLHHAAAAERMRLVTRAAPRGPTIALRSGQTSYSPAHPRDVAQALERAHPRIQPRPDFVHEETLAVVVEMIARRLVGRRVAGQDVRAVVVKVHARGIDDHAVGGEIGLAIVDQANLAANRLAQVLESDQLERARRPCAAGDRRRPRRSARRCAGVGFARAVLGHHADQGLRRRARRPPASIGVALRSRPRRSRTT